jgi:hypothetical protein
MSDQAKLHQVGGDWTWSESSDWAEIFQTVSLTVVVVW